MKYFDLVTRKVVDTKENEFCIPHHNYIQMLEYTPTDADIEEFERAMNQ